MRSVIPLRPFPFPLPAERSGKADPATAFNGFRPLTANFTQSPNEIVDLKLSGLTSDLRWTLHVLCRETIGVAYLRGGSPYDFWGISWPRWLELLDLQSVNAAKTRLARLEALGLIEVQPGERGPWGTLPNRYRLRWANDGQAASRIFHAVMRGRSRQMSRQHQATRGMHQLTDSTKSQPTDTSLIPRSHSPDTSLASAQADTPSIKQTEYPGTPYLNQSVCPSVATETNKLTDGPKTPPVSPSVLEKNRQADCTSDGLTDGSSMPAFDWKPWLKSEGSEPWPPPLLQGLRVFLEPVQVFGIQERSPWSAEGAWAILQAVRAGSRRLGKPAGALWNGLVRLDKGIRWLAEAGPMLRREGWQMEPEDGTASEPFLRSLGANRLARMGFHRLPLHGAALDRHRSLEDPSLGPEIAPEADDDNDNNNQEQEDPMPQDCEQTQAVHCVAPVAAHREEPVTRPEELGPEVRAELRTLIEAFRGVRRALVQSSPANRQGALDAFSRSWEGIVTVLEAVLPLQVQLPDEHRPIAIRQRSQIKMNVIQAVYLAVS